MKQRFEHFVLYSNLAVEGLTQMQENGWELVAVTMAPEDIRPYTLFFKRPFETKK